MNNSYAFLFKIAVTKHCPETLRCVILLKPTSKYFGLIAIIRSNKWQVDLFAVNIRAHGYSSQFLDNSFKRLGFWNRLSKSAFKSLGWISIECSFYIWLQRHCKVQTSSNTISHNISLYPKSQTWQGKLSEKPWQESSNRVTETFCFQTFKLHQQSHHLLYKFNITSPQCIHFFAYHNLVQFLY